ncbi:glycine cleavage system H-protein subunit [Ascosphaera atra]|nr:glycine cleavage system H-protein subunit [Ascosphaera atra]
MAATFSRALTPLFGSAMRIASRPALRPAFNAAPRTSFGMTRAFSKSSILDERRYTLQHEWIDLAEDNKTATIGITEYAAEHLGDVIYAELPEVDATVEAGDTIGVVESVKSAADVMTPVSGTVSEINEALAEKPKIINGGAEKEGWFAKISINDKAEFDALMDEKAYKDFTEVEGEH